MSDKLSVEVVFALPQRQHLLALDLDAGTTVAEAIRQSGIESRFPDVDFGSLQTGIWGRVVARDKILEDGDRVEIYRELERDPRDARRELANAQRLGSSS